MRDGELTYGEVVCVGEWAYGGIVCIFEWAI